MLTKNPISAHRLDAAAAQSEPSIAVIITTYNDAQFLGAAISSVLEQTRPPDDVIVVDDGSADDPTPVIEAFPGVRIVRQPNQGPAAARNTGLAHCRADYVLFLDADDVLLPCALEAGLACFRDNPQSGLVYGAFRQIGPTGEIRARYNYTPMTGDPYLRLLRINLIGMIATVVFRREVLDLLGGFNPGKRRSEDYELFLKVARSYPVASHPTLVASYRKHDTNSSNDNRLMLHDTLRVLETQEQIAAMRPEGLETLRAGRQAWRNYYARQMFGAVIQQGLGSAASWRLLLFALLASPFGTGRNIVRIVRRIAAKHLRALIH